MTKLEFLRFEDSGGFVRVVLKISFAASNSNPSEKLKQSLADGKLGTIDVDPNSLDWVEVSCKYHTYNLFYSECLQALKSQNFRPARIKPEL